MTGTCWALSFAALVSAAACGHKPDAGAAAKDSAAMTTTAGGPSKVEGFQHPESVKYDADLDVWYVSNVNGGGLEKDGNGYISRLKGDGTVDLLKFIESGKGGVTLDAPKGMALQGDTLWVADIDAVCGFNHGIGISIGGAEYRPRCRRAEYWFQPAPPRNGAEAAASSDPMLERYMHLSALNRGILLTPFHNMALIAPTVTEEDVD